MAATAGAAAAAIGRSRQTRMAQAGSSIKREPVLRWMKPERPAGLRRQQRWWGVKPNWSDREISLVFVSVDILVALILLTAAE